MKLKSNNLKYAAVYAAIITSDFDLNNFTLAFLNLKSLDKDIYF